MTTDQVMLLILIVLAIIGAILHLISLGKEGNMATELDDLKSALADEQTALVDLTAEVEEAVKKILTPGINPSDVAVAARSIRDSNANIRASAQKIKDALNPAAAVEKRVATGPRRVTTVATDPDRRIGLADRRVLNRTATG